MVKLNFTGSGSAPSTPASIGRSFSVSCSCKLMVCVETMAFFFCATAKQNRRNQIGQRLADARAGFDREVFAVLQRPRHGHGHFLLLRAELEIFRARQNARRRKNSFDLLHQVGGRSGGLMFDDGNHSRLFRLDDF